MKLHDVESGFNTSLEGEYIIKFDVHKYYTHFSGQGKKAVDYLIINDDYLYFIELKNYEQHSKSKKLSKAELHHNFHQKCEDTLSILDKFMEYMNSNWWRRYFILQKQWYFTGVKEWKWWIKAHKLYKNGHVICLLHSTALE